MRTEEAGNPVNDTAFEPYALLRELTCLHGGSGDEGSVRERLATLVQPFVDEMHVDATGNLICLKKGTGTGPRVMLAAHMDEVSLMIMGVGEMGLLRFRTVGGIDPRILIGKRVLVGPERLPGIIGVKPIHLQSAAERKSAVKIKDLRIDIGALDKAQAEGLVKRFVVEVFPWTSATPLKALRGGYPQGIVDGHIFYLNPLQRFASNELWDELVARNEPIVAMRTVSGGNVHRLRDVPGAAWKEYLQKRAVQVAPIFERSGIPSWTEFCVRFAHSFHQVRATVGSTSRPENLAEFLRAVSDIQPLPADIVAEISHLQRQWSDETDIHAEPWTM